MNVAFEVSVARPLTLQRLAVKADIPDRQVRATIELHALQQAAPLFDHLVGEREQLGRHNEAERLSGFEVDYQKEFGGLLDW